MRSIVRCCKNRSSFACSEPRHVADLVEEQRAAVGDFDLARRLLHGARERALLEAEQLRLEQRVRDRRAVDRDERLARARAQRVNRARQDFLARAAFALQQRRRVGRRHLLDRPADLQHRVARRDDAVERRRAERFRELPILGLERVHLIRALHDQLQRVDVDGLLIEVVGAEADRLHGVALVAVPRDDDDLRERRELQDLAQRREALADAAVVGRQTEVLQHDGRLVAAQLVDGRSRDRWPQMTS